MIENVLRNRISQTYIDTILTPEGMTYFSKAFTHSSVDPVNNYEFLETLGDLTLNKCVLFYLCRRFPQLNCPAGSDMISKLKISTIKSESFANIAESIGFWAFISVDQTLRTDPISKRKTLEDVCESFFGVLELLGDKYFTIGIGYELCYKIVSFILDKKEISLDYEENVDAITRVKETCDAYTFLGTISYQQQSKSQDGRIMVVAYQTTPGNNVTNLATGYGNDIKEARQDAAKQVMSYLKSKGILKSVSAKTAELCV
jgi:dsRNA-specific ribonuclease